MSKDKLTGERIYNLEVRFISKDGSKWFKYPHRLKLYENDFFRADIIMPDVWFENKDLDKYIADLEAKLAQAQKTIEIQKMSNDALQEENLDYRYDITDTAYEQAKEMASNWENQYQEEIKELKAKLAESEAEYNDTCQHYEHQFAELGKEVNRLCKREKLLDQQLAESEKRILELQEDSLRDNQIYNEQLAEKEQQYKESVEKILHYRDRVILEHNQDKISFCIEQLEKVKENLIEDLFDLYRSPCLIYETYGDEYDSVIQDAINNTIDKQIKQLSHQHEDK